MERQGRIYVFNLSSAACDKLILRAVIAATVTANSTISSTVKVRFSLRTWPTHSRQPRQYILARVLPVTVRKQTGTTATKEDCHFRRQNIMIGLSISFFQYPTSVNVYIWELLQLSTNLFTLEIIIYLTTYQNKTTRGWIILQSHL